eukprot:gene622-2482_t
MHSILATALAVACAPDGVYGHIRLDFPPSHLVSDFIDTVRSKGLCGQSGDQTETRFESSEFNAYPGTMNGVYPVRPTSTKLYTSSEVELNIFIARVHQGGYTVELYPQDPGNPGTYLEGSKVTLLTTDQPDEASPSVTLPADPCLGCLIRLLYSAEEWGANYKFKSCAVVDIVDPPDSEPTCPNDCRQGGTCAQGQCECPEGRRGRFCEYGDPCRDADGGECSGHGVCFRSSGDDESRSHCMCDGGRHGRVCETLDASSADLALGDADTLQHLEGQGVQQIVDARSLQAFYRLAGPPAGRQVEFTVVADTASWIGLGWRPESAVPGEQGWPLVDGQANSPGHPMNNADMAIMFVEQRTPGDPADGSCAGPTCRCRVDDRFSVSRSVPQLDATFDESPIASGAVDDTVSWHCARNGTTGQTKVVFRRPVKGTGAQDHDLAGQLMFIWAFGRDQGSTPQPNGIYCQNCLSYHGDNKGTSVATLPSLLEPDQNTSEPNTSEPDQASCVNCPPSGAGVDVPLAAPFVAAVGLIMWNIYALCGAT